MAREHHIEPPKPGRFTPLGTLPTEPEKGVPTYQFDFRRVYNNPLTLDGFYAWKAQCEKHPSQKPAVVPNVIDFGPIRRGRKRIETSHPDVL